MLRELLDLLTGTEAFERLLVHPSRPVVARAGAGRDLVVAEREPAGQGRPSSRCRAPRFGTPLP